MQRSETESRCIRWQSRLLGSLCRFREGLALCRALSAVAGDVEPHSDLPPSSPLCHRECQLSSCRIVVVTAIQSQTSLGRFHDGRYVVCYCVYHCRFRPVLRHRLDKSATQTQAAIKSGVGSWRSRPRSLVPGAIECNEITIQSFNRR
ncbi:hypothetical protein CONLIGDRAFT_113853 [Coniochaeta ligniaria NRRL 30616]|uniref:Uncharacterized protein n=1 Tax=Coniochaeta ligniaria NRRL 30616 TaxID=1408157 RepID=A0A1J7J235_9PEZI|nr:hypothetical protein CONLIGDRAFT_113853 [Coniochaeta ligniaria NRRL 30616]